MNYEYTLNLATRDKVLLILIFLFFINLFTMWQLQMRNSLQKAYENEAHSDKRIQVRLKLDVMRLDK